MGCSRTPFSPELTFIRTFNMFLYIHKAMIPKSADKWYLKTMSPLLDTGVEFVWDGFEVGFGFLTFSNCITVKQMFCLACIEN